MARSGFLRGQWPTVVRQNWEALYMVVGLSVLTATVVMQCALHVHVSTGTVLLPLSTHKTLIFCTCDVFIFIYFRLVLCCAIDSSCLYQIQEQKKTKKNTDDLSS